MKFQILLLLSICFPTILFCQSLNLFPRGDLYATSQSIYAINTNPANLGKHLNTSREYQLPILSGSGFISSTGLPSGQLRNIFFNRNEKIENEERSDISSFFVNEQTDLSTSWSFLSIAFNAGKNGRIGLSVGSNVNGSFKVNERAADLFFNGSESEYAYQIFEEVATGNVQEVLTEFTDGTTVNLNSGTNFDIAYGHKIREGKNVNHYFGFGLRYRLYSLGINIESEDGNFSGYTTYLDEDDNFDILGFGRPNTFFKNLFGDSGFGIFLNAGYSLETNKGLNFSVAVRNAGYSRIKGTNLSFNDDIIADFFSISNNEIIKEFSTPIVVGSLSKTAFNNKMLFGVEATSNKFFRLVSDVNLIDNQKSNLGIYSGIVAALRSDNLLLWNIPAGFRFSKDFKKINFGISWATYVLGFFDQKRPFINGSLGVHIAHRKK